MKGYLNYSIVDHEGVKVVNLSGILSHVSEKIFTDLLEDLTDKGNVILNMEDVNIVTSSGLNSLTNVCISARNKKKRIVLLRLREDIYKMIEMMDLFEYFIFVESIEEGKIKIRHYT
ncbi:MAG: STAS domain-containing protein [Spirochaetota bacterium]|nr:STAS domain-containing protein [Spirochaetota bacterium]